MDDNTCPVCAKSFRTMKSLNSHPRMAKSCSHYGMGKRRQIALDFEPDEMGQIDILTGLPDMSQNDSVGPQDDEDPQDVIEQLLHERPDDFFHFLDDVREGEAGPGP